ncbi:MAG TPA: sulfite exporter TauE/SafE family protein [Caulifigura sp.]|nr:sulfite exporter TauE/SafE family protein [Caulifigura sp.]
MALEHSEFLRLASLGFGIGAYGTLIGSGGGSVLVPALMLLMPALEPARITAISLAVVFFNAYAGTLAYLRMGRVDIRSGLLFTVAGAPGAIIGTLLIRQLPRGLFSVVLGCLLIGMGTWLFSSPRMPHIDDAPDSRSTPTPRDNLLGSVGSAYIAVLSSLLGIGGGVIHVPFLIRALRMPAHVATATSHFVLMFMALTATMTHYCLGELNDDWSATTSLAVGVMMGAPIGAMLSTRLYGTVIVRCLSIGLCMAGARMLLSAS